MAFQNANRNTNSNVQGNDDSWKAQAFLNFYIPTSDGGRRKIGALPLKEARKFEKALIERLSSGPDAIKAMMNCLEVDFQLADADVPVSNLGF